MRYRVHEWLADHVSWVQYPRRDPNYRPLWRELRDEYRRLGAKQRAWFWFFVFWGSFFAAFT